MSIGDGIVKGPPKRHLSPLGVAGLCVRRKWVRFFCAMMVAGALAWMAGVGFYNRQVWRAGAWPQVEGVFVTVSSSPRCWISYTVEGRSFHHEIASSYPVVRKWGRGARVKVRHHPGNPAESVTEEELSDMRPSIAVALAGGGGLLLAAWLLAWGGRLWVKRTELLLTRGSRAEVRVLGEAMEGRISYEVRGRCFEASEILEESIPGAGRWRDAEEIFEYTRRGISPYHWVFFNPGRPEEAEVAPKSWVTDDDAGEAGGERPLARSA